MTLQTLPAERLERSHHQLVTDLAAGRAAAGDRYRSPEAVCYDGLLYAYTGLRLSTAAEYVLRRGDLSAIVAGLLALDPMVGHAIGFAGSILNKLARSAAERLDAWQDLDVLVPAVLAEISA